jgi:hypothetical protein
MYTHFFIFLINIIHFHYNTQWAHEPGHYIRKTTYSNVNWISLDEWMTPLNISYFMKFKIKKFTDFIIEIELKSE